MKRLSIGTFVVASALALAGGCKGKDKDKAGEPGAAAKAGDVGGATTAAPGRAMYFAQFPADAEIVVSFSLEALRASPMWAQIAPVLQAKLDSEMAELKTACGFDPLTKLQTVQMSAKPGKEDDTVVVVRGFSKDELTSCGAAMAKKDNKDFVVSEEDGLTVLKSEGKTAYVSWLDASTAVMSPNPDKAWVKARIAGQGGLASNAAFMDLAKKVDPSATVWVAAMPAPGSEMDMSKSLPGAKGGYASIKITDGIGVDAGVRFDTPENAKNANSMATAAMQQGKAMMPMAVQSVIDKTQIAVAANDMTINLQMTKADIDQITAALGPMLGSMMGGMVQQGATTTTSSSTTTTTPDGTIKSKTETTTTEPK
jgi:hypothetical protein